MKRQDIVPRRDWKRKVTEKGLVFNTVHKFVEEPAPLHMRLPPRMQTDTQSYWDEMACYSFTMDEILAIERDTNELHEMCMEAVHRVVTGRRYAELHIPEAAIPLIEDSWNNARGHTLYGRFDLSYNGRDPAKMLEYNADTPTSLLEAAVIQWFWLKDQFPDADQFNSLHERLVKKWKWMLGQRGDKSKLLHFGHVDEVEDAFTVGYLRDTAEEAGWKTEAMWMEEIVWGDREAGFLDGRKRPIETIFKLYPWEWLVHDEFAVHLRETAAKTRWIEPAWKSILSNKGILAILWEMYPGHKNLLPAYLDGPRSMKYHVTKPLYSREGANVSIHSDDEWAVTGGPYGTGPVVYQFFSALPSFNGNRPVLGSWVVDGEAAGMGIREGSGPITDNTSRFVPHYIDG